VAVKIRLKRMGAKKRPFYRVVVADARSPRDGRFIESVGYYDPLREPKVVKLDDERIRHWMATGAKPSDAVRELLERAGMIAVRPRPVRQVAVDAAGATQQAAPAGAESVETVSAETLAEPEAGPSATVAAAAEADDPEDPEPIAADEPADA